MLSIKKPEKPNVTVDDIAMKFSPFGRYHLGFMFLIVLLFVKDNITCTSYVFTAEKVNYWCEDARFKNDSCASFNSTDLCKVWVYEDPHSFVAEFNLACQEWKRTLVGTVQSFGYGVGLVFVGPLSDRWGRKKMIVTTALSSMVAGLVKSFSNNYWVFITLEFLGSAIGNCYSPGFTLMMEMVASEKRVLTQLLYTTSANLGYLIVPFTAWLFPYWRHMLLVFYCPAFVFVLYIFLLDESPRWLLCKGRKEEAIAILENIAKKSKVKVDKDLYENLSYKENKGANLKDSLKETFASRILLIRFFICVVWWTAASFMSYGITVNSVLLPGNKYINYGLICIADIPARFLTFWLLTRFRRKHPLICTFFIAAAFCLVQSLIPHNLQWLSILMLLSAETVVTICFSTVYIFTSELFPTHTRNSMHATCSALGRVGSTLAPQTPLLIAYWSGLPSLMFGLAAFMAALATLFAPDMIDLTLPDTVQQAVGIGQKQPSSSK